MLAAIMLLVAGFAMLFTGQTKTAAAATPSDYWNGNLTQEQYDTLESWGYSFGTQATVTGVNVQFEYSVNTVQQAGRHASATGNFGITYDGSNKASWGTYIAYRSQKSMSGVKKSPLKIGPNPASDGSDTIYNESDSKPFSLMYPVFEREGRTNIYVLNGKYPYIKVYWGDGTEPSSERIYLLKSGPNTTTQWATEDDALPTTKKIAPPTAQNFTYDGTQKTGVLAGEGYTLSGTTTAIAAGNYTAVATLQSGYVWNDGTSNAKTISWSISALGISGASVSVPTQTYTGSALTPVPTVTLNGKTLVYGTDFTCEWTNNTDAGTGYVKVIGKGNYSGETGTVAFTISQKSMAGISASVSGSFVYNGSGHTPDPVVKDGTTQLVKDRDYTLSYNNNVNAGTASVTITGKGNYTGSKTVNFKIDKASYGVSLVTTNADFSLFAKGNLHDFLIGSYIGTPTFTSSDPNVIKVNADGTYEVVGMGKATIRVSIPGGNNYYDFNAGVEKTVEAKDCFRIVGSDGTAKYYKTLAEAVAAVPANGTATISVIGSPKMDEGVTIDNGKNITLRGENGATLVRGDNFNDAAFSITGGSLTIEDLTIDGNEGHGANPEDSLIVVSGGKLTVGEGAALTNNRVEGASGVKGGAIHAEGGEVVIRGGSFTSNSAGMGGAIYVGGSAQVTIEDGDFEGNGTLRGDGGAIYVEGGSLEIKGGTFEGNYAGYPGFYAQNGGAVAVMDGEVTISGGTMVNNSAGGVGNGVYIAPDADITLAGSGTAGITDAFGIGYDEAGNASGMINVDGALDHQVNVAFQNPAAQAQEGVEYVRSDDNTSADLKEDFRVTNPGYTFKPVDDPQNSTGALELVKSDTVVAVIEVDGKYKEFTSI